MFALVHIEDLSNEKASSHCTSSIGALCVGDLFPWLLSYAGRGAEGCWCDLVLGGIAPTCCLAVQTQRLINWKISLRNQNFCQYVVNLVVIFNCYHSRPKQLVCFGRNIGLTRELCVPLRSMQCRVQHNPKSLLLKPFDALLNLVDPVDDLVKHQQRPSLFPSTQTRNLIFTRPLCFAIPTAQLARQSQAAFLTCLLTWCLIA